MYLLPCARMTPFESSLPSQAYTTALGGDSILDNSSTTSLLGSMVDADLNEGVVVEEEMHTTIASIAEEIRLEIK